MLAVGVRDQRGPAEPELGQVVGRAHHLPLQVARVEPGQPPMRLRVGSDGDPALGEAVQAVAVEQPQPRRLLAAPFIRTAEEPGDGERDGGYARLAEQRRRRVEEVRPYSRRT